MIVIDLMGDSDDTITVPQEEDPAVVAKREALRREAILEILKRMPQPQVVIVPVTQK